MPSRVAEAPSLVVLGCRVVDDEPRGALLRRLERARTFAETHPVARVVMSGGKRWNDRSEAQVMAEWWRRHGPEAELLVEDRSLDTLENATYTRVLLDGFAPRSLALVTCDFHMRRAALLFRERGFVVDEVPAPFERSPFARLRLALREWGALRLLRYKERRG